MAYKAYVNNSIFFSTESDVDALKLSGASVSLQAGSAGEFVFTVPPCNDFYENFNKLIDFVDVYRDDDLIFSGRVFSIQKTFDTQQKITCEGLLAVLNDSIFRPVEFDGTVHELVRAILDSHNEQVDSSKQVLAGVLTVSNDACYRAYENYDTSISRLQDLMDAFGGNMYIRKTQNGLYLDWYEGFESGCEQSINFGKNLLDLTIFDDSTDIITVLIPLGAEDEATGERLTIKSVNNNQDYILAADQYINQYGYVWGSKTWDDVTQASRLKSKGQTWLASCLTPKMQINVTAVDLADAGYSVESFRVGQSIKVVSEPHGLSGTWFDCNKQSLDLLHPENNKLSLGTTKIGYVKTQRSNSADKITEKVAAKYATQSALQIAVDNTTQIINGNKGGFKVERDTNGDGLIDEVLFMDTTDVETARNVWRINQSGWGHSSNGIDGPYTMGATLDDAFVAQFITAGYLNADLLKVGRIQGQQGSTYWDLVTGDLHIEGEFDVDKSKNFVRQPSTPYFVGDLWVTEYEPTSAVVGYAVAGRSIVGQDRSGDGTGSIMMCIYTRTTGDFNANDWALVTDYIDTSALTGLQQRMSSAELNISANTASIQLKADTSVVSDLADRVSSAEIKVDGYDGRINLLATNVEEVKTDVADKSKTFYQEPVPPYVVGDTWVTGAHEEYNAIAGVAIAGKALTGWGKDIYLCIHDRAENESYSFNDWILATEYASETQLNSVRKEIRNAEVSIDAANARIDLKADRTVVTDLATRVDAAEISIDGANARIDLKADSSTVTSLASRVTQAEIDINAAEAQISSKVSVSTYNQLANRVTTAESAITQKVNSSDYTSTEIISRINSGNNTINEAKINLTAQNIVNKINGSNQKINSTNLDISAATVVDLINNGSSTINSAKVNITAAVIADKINKGSSTISEAKITLTAQNIANKINESSVKISADRIDLEGQVSISALNSDAKSNLLKNTTVKTQFYLSTSTSSATGGSWSDTVPAWSADHYIWTRTATTKTKADGTAATTYSTAVYDQNLTRALSTAETARTNANSALSRSTYHYATCSTAAGTAAKAASCTGFSLYNGATVTVYFANANTVSAPTLNVNGTGAKPIFVKNTNITKAYYWQAKDTVTFVYNGTNWVMTESSANAVIAGWCYQNDKTLIDGGMLATGTVTTAKLYAKAVTAAKIDVDDLFSQNIEATNFHLKGGSIDISTSSATKDIIELNYGNGKLSLAPGRIQLYTNNVKRFQLLAGTLMGYNSSGEVTFGLSTNTGSITLKYPLFKIVGKSFKATLSGSAASVYWKEGTIEVTPDDGYEIVGLGGYYASCESGNAYCINVYRACVAESSAGGLKFFYGFANTGVTTQTVTLHYYLLEAYTKGTVS
ncbi:MAG: phage tail protein [Parasporobacterium sp.]|nr:phage tail protein [Parasporobacterium sp.]